MGFLDRAKKLAEQALEKAEETLAEARSKTEQPRTSAPRPPADLRMGTAYVPGMLGRPGWRERGLPDPAAVLPIGERDRFGVPHGTKSQIVAEPFGVGRRWSAGSRSMGLFYQLDPDHQAWSPPSGTTPYPKALGAREVTLADGRSLVFLGVGDRSVVLELAGIDPEATASLTRTVAEQLAAS